MSNFNFLFIYLKTTLEVIAMEESKTNTHKITLLSKNFLNYLLLLLPFGLMVLKQTTGFLFDTDDWPSNI